MKGTEKRSGVALRTDTREIDKASFGFGRQKTHTHLVANAQAFLSATHEPVGHRRNKPHERAFRSDASDDGGKLVADPVSQQHCRGRFAHLSLDLARRVFAFSAMRGNLSQLTG